MRSRDYRQPRDLDKVCHGSGRFPARNKPVVNQRVECFLCGKPVKVKADMTQARHHRPRKENQ